MSIVRYLLFVPLFLAGCASQEEVKVAAVPSPRPTVIPTPTPTNQAIQSGEAPPPPIFQTVESSPVPTPIIVRTPTVEEGWAANPNSALGKKVRARMAEERIKAQQQQAQDESPSVSFPKIINNSISFIRRTSDISALDSVASKYFELSLSSNLTMTQKPLARALSDWASAKSRYLRGDSLRYNESMYLIRIQALRQMGQR